MKEDVKFQIVPSISTWLEKNKREKYQEDEIIQSIRSKQIVEASLQARHYFDDCSEFEIQNIPKNFQSYTFKDKIADSKIGFVSQLSEPCLHHVICHGHFIANNPQNSGLEIYKGNTLEAWQISQSPIKGEVFLSACMSLMQGSSNLNEESTFLGINGVGTSLYAAGADCVIGNSWRTNMFASVIFTSLFYRNRQAHSAQEALTITQKAFSELTKDEVKILINECFVRENKSLKIKCQYFSDKLKGDKPFSHPYFWAGYTILGNAPALKATKQVPWWLWWKRLFVK